MKKIVAYLIGCWLILPAFAQTPDLKKVDQLFSSWNNATPGVAIAIQQGDKIIYDKAFGLADLEHNIPNTTETIFESGSVAKQFTAFSVLLLAAEGKLSLQDDVRKYVPELPVYEAPITIQHLLNHTSGLKDWGSVGALTGWPRSTRVYTQDLALRIMSRQKSLNFKPGDRYSYSNANYSLLVTIVERVSRKSLARFTDSVFFKPLGMHNTRWRDNFREVIPNRAIAYRKSGDSYEQLMPFEHVHGHGGLLTTTHDLLIWNQLLETPSIGAAVADLRIQKGKLNDGTEIQYATGLFINEFNGFKSINHSGATAGYRAWLAYYPQKKLSVAILSNDASFSTIPARVAEIFMGKPEAAKTPDAARFISLSNTEKKSWIGIYLNTDDYYDVITFDQSEEKLQSNNREIFALHRDTLYHDNLYWIKKSNTEIQLKSSSGTRNYTRVAAPDRRPEFLRQVTGVYVSDEAEATYEIAIENDQLKLRIGAFPLQTLVPVYHLGFRDEDYTFYEFTVDKKGKVVKLDVSVNRALRVPFHKIK